MAYFRDKFGNLFEGKPGIRSSLYEEARKSNPSQKVEVRNCSTNQKETRTFGELMDESVWSILGWIAVIGVVVGFFVVIL